MPVASHYWPSLALGLLQSQLQRRNIPCRVWYANLAFAHRIGEKNYSDITSLQSPSPVGEWIFATALYPELAALPAEDYFQTLRQSLGSIWPTYAEPLLLQAREAVEPFLRSCLDALPWNQIQLVGFTTSLMQQLPALALARRLKRQFPHLKIAFGGAGCEGTLGFDLLRLFPFVDFVFHGEADLTFPPFVEALLVHHDHPSLPGLSFRQKEHLHSGLEMPPPQTDLDALPFPNYDDYFAQLDKLFPALRPWVRIGMETSRGCWWGCKSQCLFCGLNGLQLSYRCKKPGRALEELEYLVDRYPVEWINLTDNILDMHFFRTFLPQVAQRTNGKPVRLMYEVKANLNLEQIHLLRDARVMEIQPGIESLSTDVLRAMRKGVTGLQNVQLLKWGRECGLSLRWYLLYGFPGEEPASYQRMAEWLAALVHLTPPGLCMPVRLDRFSPLFEEAEQRGLVNVRPQKAYRYLYALPEEEIAKLAYYFEYDYADGRAPLSYVQPVITAWRHWKDLWEHRQAGALVLVPQGDGLGIFDSRPKAQCRYRLLPAVQGKLYRFCDQIQTFDQILEYSHQQGATIPDAELAQMLEEWAALGWMLTENSRYLGLALDLERWNHGRYPLEVALLLALNNPWALDASERA